MLQIGRIGFLGGGKVAQAMAKGFIAAGLTKPDGITASVHPADTANLELFKRIGAETIVENVPVVQNSDVIIISTKPAIVPEVLEEVRSISDGKLFISIAMGITLDKLIKHSSKKSRMVRVMPNIAAIIQQACSVFTRGPNTTQKDIEVVNSLMKSVGTCEEVDEKMFDAITALSGSGPAYIFVLIEALADGAVNMGLPRDLAYRLASQTVLGSGQLVRDTNIHPGQLKDNVTSPAGSTAAGLAYLEKKGFRWAVAGAIQAATERCRQTSGMSSS